MRLLLAVVVAATVLPASPAYAATDAVTLLAPVLAPMLSGQRGWVSAMWTTSEAVCDLRATAAGSGVTVTYPSNTSTYSSLYKDDSLEAGQLDYTAFDVAVAAGKASGSVALTISLTYIERSKSGNNDQTADPDKKSCLGAHRKASIAASIPIVAATGAAVVQKTSTVTVTRNTPVWTQLSFQGGQPGLSDFRVSLTAPPGLAVVYPGDKTSAGLNLATSLAVGQDDYVAVRLDATDLTPGRYQVPVHASYTGGTYDGTLTLIVR
jgi:hypothetical protein